MSAQNTFLLRMGTADFIPHHLLLERGSAKGFLSSWYGLDRSGHLYSVHVSAVVR